MGRQAIQNPSPTGPCCANPLTVSKWIGVAFAEVVQCSWVNSHPVCGALFEKGFIAPGGIRAMNAGDRVIVFADGAIIRRRPAFAPRSSV